MAAFAAGPTRCAMNRLSLKNDANRFVRALLNCQVLMLLECASPSCISGKAIRYEGKWRIATSIIFPLGEVLVLKEIATGCLLVSVSSALPALRERQLPMFRADQRACKTGFYLERKVLPQFFKAQRRSAVSLGLSQWLANIRGILKDFDA